MKYETAGSCTAQSVLLTIILVFFMIPSTLFQQQFYGEDSSDTNQTKWNQPFGLMKPSPVQIIQLRALQSYFAIPAEMTHGKRALETHPYTDFSQMFHDMDNSYFSYPSMDYRHGSNYIPQNVRDYTDYKMGRDRYLPIFNPVLIGFILYNVSQYANYYFGEKDSQSLFSQLNSQQKQMLLVLQDNYPLNQDSWYALFQSTFPDSSVALKSFVKEINELEKLSLLKMRTFNEEEVRYFPVTQNPSDSSKKDGKE